MHATGVNGGWLVSSKLQKKKDSNLDHSVEDSTFFVLSSLISRYTTHRQSKGRKMHRFLLILFFSMMMMKLSESVGADTVQFSNCSSTIQCGSLQKKIGYPFWGANRADCCGSGTEYHMTCVGGTTLGMILSGLLFRVLDFDNSTRVLTVAREDYYSSLCPQYLHNTTSISISPFSYSDDTLPNNLILYYNCNAPSSLVSNQFTCSVNATSSMIGFYVTTNSVVSVTSVACGTSVVLPVNRTALETTPTQASVEAALQGGFGLQWADDGGVCQRCIESGGQCGRDNSNTNNDFACYCSDKSYSSTCGSSSSSSGGSNSRLSTILYAVSIPVGVAAIASVLVVIWRRLSLTTSQIGESHFDVENFFRNQGIAPRRYRYSDLKRMTNSFSEKLGQGGYGSVYKGKLKDGDGRLVAVKILTSSGSSSTTGEDFFNEVVSISTTSHVNVVALLGFCYERKKRALVLEYMPNGSLDNFITKKRDLECKLLYQIALGIARGLEYLHRGCSTRIVHFDIKPHNILLDQDFVPKISDFGLAKLWQGKESMVSNMFGTRGTVGYIAPEVFCRNFGGVSHKSDVYSYGMLVLDMVCGRENSDARVSHSSDVNFPDWIYKEYVQLSKEDITLHEIIKMEEQEEISRKMIVVSLWCIQTRPSDRPSIKEVIEMLEGSIQALQVPPQPFLYSPERLLPQITASSSSLINGSIVEENKTRPGSL